MNGEEVDLEEFQHMIDYSMKEGFHYFDTAHGYVSQKSEPTLKTCFDYGTSKWWRLLVYLKKRKKCLII